MGRRKQLLPTLRFHKPTGQHYYWDSTAKKRVNLGANKERAERRFKAAIAKIAADVETGQQPPRDPALQITVAELALEFRRRVVPDYAHDPKAVARMDAAIRRICEFAGDELADRFFAQRLKEFRKFLIEQCTCHGSDRRYSRRYVNYLVGTIKHIWRWAAEEELIRAETAFKVRSLRPLGKGSGGRETLRVPPVDDAAIDATMPELGPIVAAMVALQRATGMRPGEVCKMRRRDLSTSPDEAVPIPETSLMARARFADDGSIIWLYVPDSHKNTSRGKVRIVAIGRLGQAAIAEFVQGKKPDDPIFSPAESIRRYSESAQHEVLHLLKMGIRDRYDTYTYARAITRAVSRVNRGIVGDAKRLDAWSPGRIRHTTATAVRAKFGREAAAEYLGHSGLEMIDTYAEQAIETAVRIAAEMG